MPQPSLETVQRPSDAFPLEPPHKVTSEDWIAALVAAGQRLLLVLALTAAWIAIFDREFLHGLMLTP